MTIDKDPFATPAKSEIPGLLTKPVEFDMAGVSVFLAIPCMSGTLPYEVHTSIVGTINALNHRNIDWTEQLLVGCSIVEKARNCLIDAFLRSDKTKLFWLDADVTWEPADFCRLLALSTKMDIVGSVYPCKKEPTTYLIRTPDMAKIQMNELGCIKLRGFGMGFCVMSRAVVEALASKSKRYPYPNYADPVAHVFKQREQGAEIIGEDIGFFQDAEEAGFEVWCDPTPKLGHVGAKTYTGQFATVLKMTAS